MSHPRNTPFFVLGAQRSGTTMLRLMLNAHPRLAVPFESEFIVPFEARQHEFGDLRTEEAREACLVAIAEDPFVETGGLVPDPAELARVPAEDYAGLVRNIFRAHAEREGASRWGDKSPNYLPEIERLALLFPDAQFIHLVRDGRDVCGSLAPLDWGKNDPIDIAIFWSTRTTIARKVGSLLGHRYMEVRYEDLVLDPEAELRRISRYLGEEYSPDMLRYDRDASRHMPGGSPRYHRSSMQLPDPSKAGAWRRTWSYPEAIVFEEIAGTALQLFGYELTERRTDLLSRIRLKLHRLASALIRA